jgi:hypothetical protein
VILPIILKMENEKEYYIATIDKDGLPLIYMSEKYKLSEIDLINLIKICLVEQRSKGIGNKLKDAYIDSTSHRIDITKDRLNRIGVKDNGDQKPTKTTKAKTR